MVDVSKFLKLVSVSLKDIKLFISKTLGSLPSGIGAADKTRQMYLGFLSKIKEHQYTDKLLENFITSAAPIVTYSQVLSKPIPPQSSAAPTPVGASSADPMAGQYDTGTTKNSIATLYVGEEADLEHTNTFEIVIKNLESSLSNNIDLSEECIKLLYNNTVDILINAESKWINNYEANGDFRIGPDLIKYIKLSDNNDTELYFILSYLNYHYSVEEYPELIDRIKEINLNLGDFPYEKNKYRIDLGPI
jgi:hypothetical protein